jgi:hypothetical protein
MREPCVVKTETLPAPYDGAHVALVTASRERIQASLRLLQATAGMLSADGIWSARADAAITVLKAPPVR